MELRECLISSDARDYTNYHFTENAWPVMYSFNRASKQSGVLRRSDVLE